MSSQRLNENPHLPWDAINLRGTSVETAHCTCMAGLGESRSHIGALLFKLEAAARAGFTKKACTDIACVVSRKSRSAVKKNRIMKLYFEIDMIGQLYSHVTLTM